MAKAMRRIGLRTGLLASAGAAGTRIAGNSGTFINGNCAGASSAATTSFCPSCRSRSARLFRQLSPARWPRRSIGWSALAGFAATFLLWFALETLLSMAKGWQLSLSGACGFRCPRGGDACGLGERLDDRPCGLGEGQSRRARRGAAGAAPRKKKDNLFAARTLPVPRRRGRLSVRPRS